MAGAWFMLSLISNRNTSQAEERLERLGRPKSLAEIELDDEKSRDRFSGMKEAVSSLGTALEPQSELEKSKLKIMLADVIRHAREDVGKVTDPKAQALFETTAEVLNGLVAAYEHFEERAEPAWR